MKSLIRLFLLGLLLRLAVAFIMPAPFYYAHFERDVEIWQQNGNIYAEHTYYNYSPLPMIALGWTATMGDLLGLPHRVSFRLLFILGDVAVAAILLWRDRRDRRTWQAVQAAPYPASACRFWLNPAHIVFSAFLCSFEIWAVAPLLFAAAALTTSDSRRNSQQSQQKMKVNLRTELEVVGLGILAVLIKQNIAFLIWTLYIYRYGVKRGAFMLLATATAFAATFIPYLPIGAEGIWRNVLTYGGAELYGLGLIAPKPLAALICYGGLLALPVIARWQGIDLRRALFLSALLFCGLAWGASPAMFALPLVLATDERDIAILSAVCFLLFCPLTWDLASIPIFKVSWFSAIGAVIWLLRRSLTPIRSGSLADRPSVAVASTAVAAISSSSD